MSSGTHYARILEKVVNTPWLITPEGLQLILDILDSKVNGIELSDEQMNTLRQNRNNREPNTSIAALEKPSVGVINISGPIFPKANIMTEMSGATSIETLRNNFKEMVASPMVTGIMLNIDSPGGTSDLVMEMGDEIYNARGSKPIVAFANTKACSAAYWLGSQADKFYVTPSGSVGSIGVYTVHEDVSAKKEKEGINTTIISAGKYKVEGNPFAPLSEEAKSHMQDRVDETYNEFLAAVARGRGITEEVVKEQYGNGRTYRAKQAQEVGMVDGVETFDNVLGMMTNMDFATTSSTYATSSNTTEYMLTPIETKEDRTMPEFSPETLEALGLGEEATYEDIETAVMGMATELAPLREAAAKQAAFAEQFPEEARMLAELRERDLVQSAKLFSESYESFGNGFGLSAAALTHVEDMHKAISSGNFTHDNLASFLNMFKDNAAVVDYRELGTTREAELILASDSREAATQIATLARDKQAEAGGPSKLSWGDAVAQVAAEHPELARQYTEGGE